MSLYNALFGVNPHARVVLGLLGTTADAVPRFRDAFFALDEESGEPRMVIHTRTGGGNREEYEDQNEEMRGLPGFIRDADADYDATYANFFYEVPERVREVVRMALVENPQKTPDERWREVFEALRARPPEAPARAAAVAPGVPATVDQGTMGAVGDAIGSVVGLVLDTGAQIASGAGSVAGAVVDAGAAVVDTGAEVVKAVVSSAFETGGEF